MKRALVFALVGILGFGGITPAQAVTASCKQIKVSSAPSKQKAILLPCLDGKSNINFNAIRGPIVVNVWGSWCEPCKQEIPYFVALQKTGKVQIVGVDVEERNRTSAQKFISKKKMSWPNLYDENSVTRSLFGFGVPVTWFIDARGKVVYKHIGVMHSQKELFNEVKKYLGIVA